MAVFDLSNHCLHIQLSFHKVVHLTYTVILFKKTKNFLPLTDEAIQSLTTKGVILFICNYKSEYDQEMLNSFIT